MKLRKSRLIAFAAGVLSLMLIVGSWAFFSSTSAIENQLHTKDHSVKTVEEFTPDQELQPGDTVTKEVGVTNTGDYDLVVRIKMDEAWKRNNVAFIEFASGATGFNTVAKGGTDPDFTYTAIQGGVDDGDLTDDQSVMYKALKLAGTGETGWIDGGDGYWYYNKLLAPSLSTGALLESLTLADNTDIGKKVNSEKYSVVLKDNQALTDAQDAYDAAQAAYKLNPTAANKATLDAAEAALDTAYAWLDDKPTDTSTITFIKAATTIDPAHRGYADANYTLTVTTEVCQATPEAVDATWTSPVLPDAVRTAWGW